jgi:hypothetical protein
MPETTLPDLIADLVLSGAEDSHGFGLLRH